ncbi:MAG: helix-turn-helix transcriptional regulator [Candidatus Competibacteraceae bacterium]|nr:helix-turn-helix transcriptional regulator [Candidatus Competibacteraceae bacterium]
MPVSMNPIRSYRKQHGLSQTAFGRLVGLPQTTVSSYESGVRNPSHRTAKRIHDKTNGELPIHALLPDIFANSYVQAHDLRQPITQKEVESTEVV